MAYEGGTIWQENTSNLWYSKKVPSDTWTSGTSVSPIPGVSSGPNSPDGTLVFAGGSPINLNGFAWSIANGQVAVNGQDDGTTANVIAMTSAGGLIWQENTRELWYSKKVPSDTWTQGVTTVPIKFTLSPDNMMVTQPDQAIVDAGDVSWTFHGGQILVDGVVDPTTANVIEIEKVGNQLWQENAAKSWFAKSLPSDTWINETGPPSGGPSNGTTLTWVGGGDNQASNPNDWSPTGVPQPGDSLVMIDGTMNIAGNDLAGDTLLIPDGNVSGDTIILNLSGGANINVEAAVGFNTFTINVTDATSDSVNFIQPTGNGFDVFIDATVNLADNASLLMTGNMQFAYYLNATGGEIVNNGVMSFPKGTIAANLIGTGTINTGSYHDGTGGIAIDGFVGPGQTIDIHGNNFGARLTVQQPGGFNAAVNIAAHSNTEAKVLLAGVTATDYNFINGLLTLFDGNQLTAALRLDNQKLVDHVSSA